MWKTTSPDMRDVSMKIFVRHLAYTATEQEVCQLFEPYGVVERVNLMQDRLLSAVLTPSISPTGTGRLTTRGMGALGRRGEERHGGRPGKHVRPALGDRP
jgi:hypothetical protein